MTPPVPPEQRLQQSIREEAGRWCARLSSARCTADTEMEFRQWLAADPLHALAYEQCKTLWAMTENLKQDKDIRRELAAARAAAGIDRESASENNAPGEKRNGNYPSKQRYWWLLAAAMVAAVGLSILLTYRPYDIYSTRIGEQRLVRLDDGSTIMLNTDTEIGVHLSRGGRLIELRRGEAYFDVAKDRRRPFEVRASSNIVRALGTEFNILIRERAVSVSVAEGVVEIEKDGLDTPEVVARLRPGEAVICDHENLSPEKVPEIKAADLKRISAWRKRKLYFEFDRLADAVEEYNRYTEKKIVLFDKALESELISGVFDIGDMDSFLFSIEQVFDAHIVKENGRILVMSHR